MIGFLLVVDTCDDDDDDDDDDDEVTTVDGRYYRATAYRDDWSMVGLSFPFPGASTNEIDRQTNGDPQSVLHGTRYSRNSRL